MKTHRFKCTYFNRAANSVHIQHNGVNTHIPASQIVRLLVDPAPATAARRTCTIEIPEWLYDDRFTKPEKSR